MTVEGSEHEDAFGLPYASPAALRAALTARIKTVVRADPSHGFAELARQFGYDRLLARLNWADESGKDMWVLKGATALLARLRTAARHSLDIDLYRKDTADVADAERALREGAARDLGDFFTFDLGRAAPLADTANGLRIPVVARLGAAWSRFHVDLVVGLSMTGQPDTVAPLTTIEIPGLSRSPYRAYPIADHIADKVAATLEQHTSAGGRQQGSTRVKDAVDLLIIARTQSVDAGALHLAVASEMTRRGLPTPTAFTVPDEMVWTRSWRTVAGKSPYQIDTSLADALPTIKALLDPVLSGSRHTGTWRPASAEWIDQTECREPTIRMQLLE